MSLFGGIFQSSGISAGLFSDASKYKAHSSSGPLVEQPPQQADTQQPKKKRKHDLAGDAGLADCHAGIAPAQTAGKAAAPTSKNLKQATAADGTAISQQVHKKAKKQHAVPQSTTQSPGQAAVQQQEQQEQHPQLQENNKKLKKQKRQGQLDKQHKGNADEAVGGLHKTTSGIKGKPRPPATAAAAAAAVAAASAATPPSHVGKESSDDYTTIATTGVAESAKQQQQQQQQQQHDEDPAVAAEKLTRTIFVGNLPVTVKAKTLRRRFAEYGSVDSVRLRSVPLDLESKKKLPRKAAVIKGSVGTDRGGAKAYVVFEDASAAEAALAANMTELEGHHIRVDRAAPPSAAAAAAAGGDAGSGRGGGNEAAGGVLYDPVRSVFVGNLDWKISEEELIRVFSDGGQQPELAGSVEAVRVVRDSHTNLGKGIAYVLFTTKAAARAALQLDGQKLGKRSMRVSRVNRRASATSNSKAVATGAARRLGGRAPAGLGVNKGGVHKQQQQQRGRVPGQQQQQRSRQAGSDGNAGDWQGLRTKGKGGFRGPSAALGKKAGLKAGGRSRGGAGGGGAPGKAGSKGKAGKSKAKGGKRPAVAARKAAQKATAKRKARS